MANKEKMNAEACELKDEECKVCEDKAEDIDKPEGAEEELAAKEEENADDDMANKYVRLMAEFQNYKKRVSKEKDDLRRALQHDTDDEGFVTGMQMIFKQMLDKLNKAGLEEIQALGADFDPNFHNAVLTGDDPQYESGKVTDVMQKGYTLNGKVIRAAMVKVNN